MWINSPYSNVHNQNRSIDTNYSSALEEGNVTDGYPSRENPV